MRRSAIVAAVTGALLALAGAWAAQPAAAAFVAGAPIDGPSAGLVGLGNLALGLDGTGAVVYLRQDFGVAHVFVSTTAQGTWSTARRLDVSSAGPSSAPLATAASNGALVAVWLNGGSLWAAARTPFAGSFGAPTLVFAAPPGEAVSSPALDMSVDDVAYIAFTLSGPGVSQVRVARHEGSSWIVQPAPMNIDPTDAAGQGAARPAIAAAADGSALVTWGEQRPDGHSHVFARRVMRDLVSAFPQELSVPSLAGHVGLDADASAVGTGFDSSFAWTLVRQTFDDGSSRVLARRLVGSQFDPPIAVDGQGFPSAAVATAPRLALNGNQVGLAAVTLAGPGTLVGAAVRDVTWPLLGAVWSLPLLLTPAIDSAAPGAAPAISLNGTGAIAWQTPAGPAVVADAFGGGRLAPHVVTLSAPALGPSAAELGLSGAADRAGDLAFAFMQGPAVARSLVIAFDEPTPPRPQLGALAGRQSPRPLLRWSDAFSAGGWVRLRYQVLVDGRVIGTTTRTVLRAPYPLRRGGHAWRVVALTTHGVRAVSAVGRFGVG